MGYLFCKEDMMFNIEGFEDLAKKLYQALPQGMKDYECDLQAQFKDILQSAFNRLDLVTREEFEVQTKVLARTREKVEALQKQLDNVLQDKN